MWLTYKAQLLLDRSARNGVEQFIHKSFSCIYETIDKPMNGNDPILASNVDTSYATPKYLGELYSYYYFKHNK